MLEAKTTSLEAELELASAPAERLTIMQRLVSVAKQREEYATELAEDHAVSKIELLSVKALRLRAEANLLREQHRK